MKGLLLRNFYLIKKNIPSYFGFFLAYTVVSLFLKSFNLLLLLVFSSMYVSANVAFNIESMGWRRMEKTLPLSTYELVLSRYITTFIVAIVSSLIAVLINLILPMNGISITADVPIEDVIMVLLNNLTLYLFFHCFLTPVAILNPYGGKPSEWYVITIFLTVVFDIGTLIYKPSIIVITALIVLLYILSFKLSVLIYNHTEL